MYTITETPANTIDTIKDEWLSLENGDDMTFYQTWGWNKALSSYLPNDNGIVSTCIIVKKNDIPILIAPLVIVTRRIRLVNKPCCYFIGHASFSDYVNLIYREFDAKSFQFLTKYVSNKYNVNEWYFEQLKQDTKLFEWLTNIRPEIKTKLSTTGCASLVLCNNYDEYLKSLSKSVRQNLRTAANRANKDGVTFVTEFDTAISDPSIYADIRDQWSSQRGLKISKGQSLKTKIAFMIKYQFVTRHKIHWHSFVPFEVSEVNTKIMHIVDSKTGKVAAFFNYAVDNIHKEVLVMAAGVNSEYTRYSPGMQLMSAFIKYCIENTDIHKIDFTRGLEPYKFSLGSTRHDIVHFNIKF